MHSGLSDEVTCRLGGGRVSPFAADHVKENERERTEKKSGDILSIPELVVL